MQYIFSGLFTSSASTWILSQTNSTCRLGEPRNTDISLFALCVIPPAIFLCFHFSLWVVWLNAILACGCESTDTFSLQANVTAYPNQPDHTWWINATTPQVFAQITVLTSSSCQEKHEREFWNALSLDELMDKGFDKIFHFLRKSQLLKLQTCFSLNCGGGPHTAR